MLTATPCAPEKHQCAAALDRSSYQQKQSLRSRSPHQMTQRSARKHNLRVLVPTNYPEETQRMGSVRLIPVQQSTVCQKIGILNDSAVAPPLLPHYNSSRSAPCLLQTVGRGGRSMPLTEIAFRPNATPLPLQQTATLSTPQRRSRTLLMPMRLLWLRLRARRTTRAAQ